MLHNIESPCNTCTHSDICLIYNQYKFIAIASCKKYVGSESNTPISRTLERPERDKSIDLKQFYPHKTTILEKGHCKTCDQDDIGMCCEVCGEFVCEECSVYDINSKKTLCQECYDKGASINER